ncbi:alpha/beta hydrolase [Aliikangiella sp. IMCC44359]|uniref:alpha/beta hydrolase n=1 Tax=Aliikangiella sp. IMCC44359 TaxID=3459125 RepID=UPI00403AB267
MNLLPHIEVNPQAQANASVIWLHGLGADGNDFKPIVPQLNLPENSAVRFIFPHAPTIPVTINGGMSMPAWYDILAMDIDRKVDDKQLRSSAREITQFIENEINRGIPSERIIIAGFSQGGAVAFETLLTCSKPLAGLLAMSTYFATKDSIQYHIANQQTPIFIHHGDFDPVVPVALGKASNKLLKSLNYNVSLKTYSMEHAVCPQQIADIGEWLRKVLSL